MLNKVNIDQKLRISKLEDVYKEPISILVNKFDEEAFADFHDDFEDAINSGQEIIPIVIDSYGGSAFGLIGMVNMIESSPVPIATILLSKAMSAGALLFSFGTEGHRYMHPEAWMMIHDVGSATFGKIEEIKADTKQMDDMNKQIYRRMSLHIGQPATYIAGLIKQNNHVDWFLTAKEAKKHNIANHLRIPKFTIDIGVTVNFG